MVSQICGNGSDEYVEVVRLGQLKASRRASGRGALARIEWVGGTVVKFTDLKIAPYPGTQDPVPSPRFMAVHDLAVIIVSTNDARWLRRCLPTVFAASGGLHMDVVVIDNSSTDGTGDLVASQFPKARVVTCENHGFAYANNRGLRTVDARYVLFLNPDTEVVEGSFGDLIGRMEALPDVGLAGCRQLYPSGALTTSMCRFPTAVRLLCEALGAERWPIRASWTGQRELNLGRYAQEFELDWTVGAFMLARREALESAGWLDERLFLYSDEPDLAMRMKRAGWSVRHLPQMAIVHHAKKMGWSERGHAQYGYAYRHYFAKHLPGAHRVAAVAALAVGYGLRALAFPVLRRAEPDASRAMRAALRTTLGRAGAPYEAPPRTAVRARVNGAAAANGAAHGSPLVAAKEPARPAG